MRVPTGVSGNNQSSSHWAKAPPAVATFGPSMYVWKVDPNNASAVKPIPVGMAPAAQTVLAADMVYYSGTTANPPVYNINHPKGGYMLSSTGFAPIPDFQNVLYGDGRVEGHDQGEYPLALNDVTYAGPSGQFAWDFSMKFANNQPGYYYWGEQESTPMLTGLTPPPDKIPPNPNAGNGGDSGKAAALPTGVVASPPAEPPHEGTPQPIPNQ